MLANIERKNSNKQSKSIESKRMTRFMQVIQSFDNRRTTIQSKKSLSLAHKQKIQNIKLAQMSKNGNQSLSINKYKGLPSINRSNQNISTISKSSNSKKASIPSISLQIYLPKRRYQIDQNMVSNRLKTQSIDKQSIKLPKILLRKIQGAPTGNLVQFLRLKPTEKYFSKRQNVRLAEKLLLVKPSKDLSRCEHQKFYKEQKSFRSISQSRLRYYKNFSSALKKSKHQKDSKSQWVD